MPPIIPGFLEIMIQPISRHADTVIHQYQYTGTFNACLVAYNQFECADTACQDVQSLINPLLDVPNAFTPGRFGANSIIKVKGFGIISMNWKIYNRWGQLVFQSNTPYQGWDGTFNGVAQPMEFMLIHWMPLLMMELKQPRREI